MFEFPTYEIVAVPPEPYDQHNVAKIIDGDIDRHRARAKARAYATACATPVDWHWKEDGHIIRIYDGTRQLMMSVVVQEKTLVRWHDVVASMGLDPRDANDIFRNMTMNSFEKFLDVFFPNNNLRTRKRLNDAFLKEFYK